MSAGHRHRVQQALKAFVLIVAQPTAVNRARTHSAMKAIGPGALGNPLFRTLSMLLRFNFVRRASVPERAAAPPPVPPPAYIATGRRGERLFE